MRLHLPQLNVAKLRFHAFMYLSLLRRIPPGQPFCLFDCPSRFYLAWFSGAVLRRSSYSFVRSFVVSVLSCPFNYFCYVTRPVGRSLSHSLTLGATFQPEYLLPTDLPTRSSLRGPRSRSPASVISLFPSLPPELISPSLRSRPRTHTQVLLLASLFFSH